MGNKLLIVGLLLFIVLLSSCTSSAPSTPTPILSAATATPRVTPVPTTTIAPLPTATPLTSETSGEVPEPPGRDLYALAQRLKLKSETPIKRSIAIPPESTLGQKDTFTILDTEKRENYQVNAELRHISPHAYWYVAIGERASDIEVKRAADAFEERIYPLVTETFGPIWPQGATGNLRLTIINAPIRGLLGYYSSADEYPREVHPTSNQRKAIYMNSQALEIGSSSYLATLTHELQHATHWVGDPDEDTWVNEGLSELASQLWGARSSLIREFIEHPNTQLTAWPEAIAQSGAHYGAAHLFFRYLTEHYGPHKSLKTLVQDSHDSILGVESYLRKLGYGLSFDAIFKEWVIANLLNLQEGSPFGYSDPSFKVVPQRSIEGFGSFQGSTPQYSADYISIRAQGPEAVIRFNGTTDIQVIPTEPPSGSHCWWGNQGDSIDSTLTREIDLSSVSQATLQFSTWFNIEKDWDYGYVMVSADKGLTWDILPGKHTRSDNPTGNSYGHGLTGKSGIWIEEEIDLSRYARKRVLLRFEYITDDALNLDGICLDNIDIPQIRLFDDAETDNGWSAEGFVRTDNRLPQSYIVQVVDIPVQGDPRVREMALDKDNTGEVAIAGLGTGLKEVVVVVSPINPFTRQPATYTVTLGPRP